MPVFRRPPLVPFKAAGELSFKEEEAEEEALRTVWEEVEMTLEFPPSWYVRPWTEHTIQM